MDDNPRKFRDKIKLLNQKQAEDTASFEEIMKEIKETAPRTSGCQITPKLEEEDLLQVTSRNINYSSLPNIHSLLSEPGERCSKIGSRRDTGPVIRNSRSIKRDHAPYYCGSNRITKNSCNSLSPPRHPSLARTKSDSALHSSSSVTEPGIPPHASNELINNYNENHYYRSGFEGQANFRNDFCTIIPSNKTMQNNFPFQTTPRIPTTLDHLVDFRLEFPPYHENNNSPSYSTRPSSFTNSQTSGSPKLPSPDINHVYDLFLQAQHQHQQQQLTKLHSQSQVQHWFENTTNPASQFADNQMMAAYPPLSNIEYPRTLGRQLSIPSSLVVHQQIQDSPEFYYVHQRTNEVQQSLERISMNDITGSATTTMSPGIPNIVFTDFSEVLEAQPSSEMESIIGQTNLMKDNLHSFDIDGFNFDDLEHQNIMSPNS